MNRTDTAAALLVLRRFYARLSDDWVQALILRFEPLVLRMLLDGADTGLRGLFFHWMFGKDLSAYLDQEQQQSDLTPEHEEALLVHLALHADFLPRSRGRVTRKRLARNRGYAAELPQRLTLYRALQAEEARNLASSPDVCRLTAGIKDISEMVRREQQTRLEHRHQQETDPWLHWILACALGQADPDQPPADDDPVAAFTIPDSLENAVQQLQQNHRINLQAFCCWGCRAVLEQTNPHFIQDCARLFLEMPRDWLEDREYSTADPAMIPLSCSPEQTAIMLRQQGSVEYLGRIGLTHKLAAFIRIADTKDAAGQQQMAEQESDPFISACFMYAVQAKNGKGSVDQALQQMQALAAKEQTRLVEELQLGIRLYSMLMEPESDAKLVALTGNLSDEELDAVTRHAFVSQPLQIRAAVCRRRCRRSGVLALEFINDQDPWHEEGNFAYIYQLEPFRLLGKLLSFHVDGLSGDEMRNICNALLPIHLRTLQDSLNLLVHGLGAWMRGATTEQILGQLATCPGLQTGDIPDWSARRAYREVWSLHELRMISFSFRRFSYPSGFMTMRRKDLLSRFNKEQTDGDN